jgi:hypothetical protein
MNNKSTLNSSPISTFPYPTWVEKYPMGKINMKTQETSKFKKDQLEYTHSTNIAHTIMKDGNNSSIKLPLISNQVKKLPKTEVLYENFTNNKKSYISSEKFGLPLNMESHINPVWVLIIFLIAIWIIYFIAN